MKNSGFKVKFDEYRNKLVNLKERTLKGTDSLTKFHVK